jgi:hypothetical protein
MRVLLRGDNPAYLDGFARRRAGRLRRTTGVAPAGSDKWRQATNAVRRRIRSRIRRETRGRALPRLRANPKKHMLRRSPRHPGSLGAFPASLRWDRQSERRPA